MSVSFTWYFGFGLLVEEIKVPYFFYNEEEEEEDSDEEIYFLVKKGLLLSIPFLKILIIL